jgi:tetratricopeptide (TPR) repeat protein
MRRHGSLAVLLLAFSIGCVSRGSGRSIAGLEQERSLEPNSFAANRALGIRYYEAGRHADARSALQTAARLQPNDGTTALYLGLTAEELGDLPAAKRAYSTYLEVGRTRRVRRQLESRLAALTRRELAEDAKQAIRQERELGAVVGSPATVAVFPLRFSGTDSSLRPLERGFAELLATDLSRSSKLTVLERSRIQALLDELALQQRGGTDASTNVRAGRLLRAGRVVQGSILQVGESDLRVDAAVLDVPTTQIRGTTKEEDGLDQLFALEKRIALGLFDQLGVELTVAERNAIEQRPTRSLAAFLAYSRGLAAEDDGRFDDASRFYRDAIRLDPGFGAARQRDRDALLIAGSRQTGHALEASLRRTAEGSVDDSHGRGNDVADAARDAADDLNPSSANAATAPGKSGAHGPPQKDPASSATNTDKPGKSGKVGRAKGVTQGKGPKPK